MRWMVVAGCAMAALAACTGKKGGPAAISRERFVQANADLRSIPDTAAKGDSLRAAALRRRHVTEADLRRFVTVHGRNLDYMSTVWREVSDSVQKRYDESFAMVHPTHDRPNAGGPDSRPDAVRPPQEQPLPQQPPAPPHGVERLSPQRPHPPKLPANQPRLQPRNPRMKPPTEPPADTKPWALVHPDTLKHPER